MQGWRCEPPANFPWTARVSLPNIALPSKAHKCPMKTNRPKMALNCCTNTELPPGLYPQGTTGFPPRESQETKLLMTFVFGVNALFWCTEYSASSTKDSHIQKCNNSPIWRKYVACTICLGSNTENIVFNCWNIGSHYGYISPEEKYYPSKSVLFWIQLIQ